MRFLVLLLVPIVLAEICPMEKHTVCNENYESFACTCQVAQADEGPVPLISCNTLIARDLETGNFPVASVEFNLDDSTNGLEDWPEDAFRDKISSSLRVAEEDIIILRASCVGTENSLTVQFVILEKDTNTTTLPFEIDDLIDAESITTRMKAMGHLSQIGNLDVDSIEFTEDLIDIEYDPSNVDLILIALATGLIFGLFLVMGILKLVRSSNEYADDLQKA